MPYWAMLPDARCWSSGSTLVSIISECAEQLLHNKPRSPRDRKLPCSRQVSVVTM